LTAGGAVSRADAVRAFGVTFGGALALDMLFAVAILTSARAVRRRRRPSALAVGGTAAAVVYATAVRRWMDHWGVECGESPAHAVEIHQKWQHRELGERVMHKMELWTPGNPVRPRPSDRPPGWGSFELEQLPGDRTRLVARGESQLGAERLFYTALVQLPHFVMERKMLLGIKRCAEAASRELR
jgi:hypothetical protein